MNIMLLNWFHDWSSLKLVSFKTSLCSANFIHSLKGALDKSNIYLFVSTSIEDCKSNYRSEPSIVPCSIIIPPPNFQKKSEILKISENNPTAKFWVTVSIWDFSYIDLQREVQQLNWKFEKQSLEQSCCLSTTNVIQSSGKYPTPCFANVDIPMVNHYRVIVIWTTKAGFRLTYRLPHCRFVMILVQLHKRHLPQRDDQAASSVKPIDR